MSFKQAYHMASATYLHQRDRLSLIKKEVKNNQNEVAFFFEVGAVVTIGI